MGPCATGGDGITLNSNVFTVCSASISPDPPEEPAALPRRPVVLSTSSTLLRKRPVEPQRALEEGAAAAAQSGSGAASRKDRIPRPPNAFMLFANEFRKKLSCENPRESNKDISVRLGTMWKMMTKEKKDTYFELARLVDAEHKKKYPGRRKKQFETEAAPEPRRARAGGGMAGAAHLLAMDCCNQGDSCQGYPGGGPGGGHGGHGGGHGSANNYPPGGYPGYNPLQDLQAFSYSHYPEYNSPYQSCSLGGSSCAGNCAGGCGGNGGGGQASQMEFNNGYSYGNGYSNGYGGSYSPDYVYNPKEARLRKAMRDQVRCRSQGVRTPGASAGATAGASAVTPATARPPQSPHSPASPMKKKILLSPR
ncbi:hypothetical protein FOCC_FOCC016449, partial [Frankliniella occidentalis]